MKRLLIIGIAFLLPSFSFSSENTIHGFVVKHKKMKTVIGSNDDKLVTQTMKNQQLQYVEQQLNYVAKHNKYVPLSVKLGLKQMVHGEMKKKYLTEYHYLSELLIRQMGKEIDDKGIDNPLSNYLDLWLDAPEPFFKQLGLKTIANIWTINKNPFVASGPADWPAINSLSPKTIDQAQKEFEAINLKSILTMEKIVVNGRGDEYTQKELREIMFNTISELAHWVDIVYKHNQKTPLNKVSLVFLFDGDL